MSALAASSTRAYRPLRGRGLLAQAILVAIVEGLLLAAYASVDAGFHWSTHLLVAVTAVALWHLGWLAVKATPARGQIVLIVPVHLLAMLPDVLFFLAVAPHEAWMDVFLGHISAHEIPGGDETWLVLAVVASGAYAAMLGAWVRSRRIESDAGRAPGIGVSRLLRPSRASRARRAREDRLRRSARPPAPP